MRDKVLVGDGKTASDYSLNVCIVSKTGKIESAYCNCKCGLAEVCSHVGGLLLYLNKITNACTSKLCEWLKPQTKKIISPKRLKDIKFVNTVNEKEQPIKPYPGVYQAGPCCDPDTFFKDIMNELGLVNANCVLYKTLNPSIVDLSAITDKYKPELMYADTVNTNSTVCQSTFRSFVLGIELTQDEVNTVHTSTKGQSVNLQWREVRTHVMTASNFGSVCKKKLETVPDNLIRQLRGYNPSIETKSLKYGRKKESVARKHYVKHHMRRCGHGVSVEQTGLSLSQEHPFLGASVDGIVKCEKCGTGVLEIKCPFSGRNMTPKGCVKNKNFYSHIGEKGQLDLNQNHSYMYQIMGQMKILDLDWCDFVIWTKKGLNVQRIVFDKAFWQDKMLFKLKFFYSSFFAAEIFTERVKRGKPLMK